MPYYGLKDNGIVTGENHFGPERRFRAELLTYWTVFIPFAALIRDVTVSIQRLNEQHFGLFYPGESYSSRMLTMVR